METFDIINIQPHKSIKVIGYDKVERINLIRNMTHIFHTRHNMEVIIVSSSYSTHVRTKYEHIFTSIISFFQSISNKEINFNQNTILVLDDCIGTGKYLDNLTNVSRSNKFCNIIFTVSTSWSIFWSITTDVTFCLKGVHSRTISDYCIDKKIIPVDVFVDIYNDCIRDNNILMISKKDDDMIMKKCVPENINTFVDYHNDIFSYHKNVHALYHIYNDFSIYHDINGKLYKSLWNNVNFIVKCSYVFFIFDILRGNPYDELFLPRELHHIILHCMIASYQKNTINFKEKKKKSNDENIDILSHVIRRPPTFLGKFD